MEDKNSKNRKNLKLEKVKTMQYLMFGLKFKKFDESMKKFKIHASSILKT